MCWACSTNWEQEKCISDIVERPEAKRPLGRPYVSGLTILKWILEIGWGGIDWIDLAQDRYL
jgi:hypothetical protein